MPLLSTVILLVVAVLVLTKRRIGAALEQTGVKFPRDSTNRYVYRGSP